MQNNTSNKIVIIILAALVIISGTIAAVAVMQTNEPPLASMDSVTEPTVAAESNALEQTYMNGCVADDITATSYCQCTYDYITANYGTAGMMEIAANYNNVGPAEYGEIHYPVELLEAVSVCIEQL